MNFFLETQNPIINLSKTQTTQNENLSIENVVSSIKSERKNVGIHIHLPFANQRRDN